jgi:hypothetical protein
METRRFDRARAMLDNRNDGVEPGSRHTRQWKRDGRTGAFTFDQSRPRDSMALEQWRRMETRRFDRARAMLDNENVTVRPAYGVDGS